MEINMETVNESDKTSTKFTGYHAFYRSVAVSIRNMLLNSITISFYY